MSLNRERILLVENDPEICDFISRQTLKPSGYQVVVAHSAAEAINLACNSSPDILIVNLHLPGLSGKDLLVALSAQGIDVPTIVVSSEGDDKDIIQAFRLGATDYLHWPMREAEVISAVERILKEVRARRERLQLSKQLSRTNRELQQRVRELTTIFALGKAVTSITDLQTLFEKIVEGAVYITKADRGWLLLRADSEQQFILRAQRNLPKAIHKYINRPWDDGISSLVGLSGEPLSLHGKPLQRFKISALGQAALVMPVKTRKMVFGLLVVLRQRSQPFAPSDQALLEAVADYASISIVNARLFQALEERVRASQGVVDRVQSQASSRDEMVRELHQRVLADLKEASRTLERIFLNDDLDLNVTLKSQLHQVINKLQKIRHMLSSPPVPQRDHVP